LPYKYAQEHNIPIARTENYPNNVAIHVLDPDGNDIEICYELPE